MISFKNAKAYCCEDISLIENYEQALNDTTQTWHLHHRLELLCPVYKPTKLELIEFRLYYNRPACELIFLTPSEHLTLHTYGKKFTDEHKSKISKALKGQTISKEVIEKNRLAQKKTYIECIETGEVHYLKEWQRLGFRHVGEVSKNGYRCKGYHFRRIS